MAETPKKILLITTGGTIASVATRQGLRPRETGEDLLRLVGHTGHSVTVRDLFSLDSTNIEPEEWRQIAECVYQERLAYDGIVIAHGTDTMAYTASALTFMLPGIDRPVVLTGSQLPISHPLSDAPANLRCAFAMAAAGRNGVFIAFNRRVFLGCRAVKVRASDLDAFESVNLPPVATVNASGFHVHDSILRGARGSAGGTPCALRGRMDSRVALVKLNPGAEPALFSTLDSIGCQGVVIEAYGAGGISFNRRDIVAALEGLGKRGIPLVVCSQCLYEPADMTVYEVGRRALTAGVIPAGDMTSEAAVTKLMWGLGQGMDVKGVSALFQENLHGEITLS